MVIQMTNQDNNTNQNRKINRLEGTQEMAYLTKHAKRFDRVEDRAKDLGVSNGTYRHMMKHKYCNWLTLGKIKDKIAKEQTQAA